MTNTGAAERRDHVKQLRELLDALHERQDGVLVDRRVLTAVLDENEALRSENNSAHGRLRVALAEGALLKARTEKAEALVARLEAEIARFTFRKPRLVTEAHSAVLDAFSKQPAWRFDDLKRSVPSVPSKQLSNALGYLVRKGRLQHVGYGRYALLSEVKNG